MFDEKGSGSSASGAHAGAGNSVANLFAQIGITSSVIGILFGILLIDLLLTSEVPTAKPLKTNNFDMRLVTHDGRPISSIQNGVTMILSPMTVYENKPGQEEDNFRTNSFGLRGPEIDLVPTRPRVIVVGGSTAWGLNVPEDETFTAALQRQLPQYEFLNAGVVGYLSAQELGLAVSKLLSLQPDLIIALDGWNDVYDNYWWSILGDPGISHRGVNVTFNFMENRLVNYHRVQTSARHAIAEAGRAIVSHSTILSTFQRLRDTEVAVREIDHESFAWFDGMLADYVSNIEMLADVARSRDCSGAEITNAVYSLATFKPQRGGSSSKPEWSAVARISCPSAFGWWSSG